MGVIGTINWTDLTVANAEGVRDFYRDVVGWKVEEVSMGEYADFSMRSPINGATVAGICHARGVNADVPPQWLVYINVADLDESMERCKALGGKVRVGPNDMGAFGRMCIIEDPAGACAGLIQQPRDEA